MLGIWRLPDTICQAIDYHYDPSRQTESALNILTAVHVSKSFLNIGLTGGKENGRLTLGLRYFKAMNISDKIGAGLELRQQFIFPDDF